MTPVRLFIAPLSAWLLLLSTFLPKILSAQPVLPNAELERKFADLFNQLPPLQRHFDGLTEADSAAQRQRQSGYEALLREKLQDKWFAALVSEKSADAFAIQSRFETWKGLVEFLAHREALVEVWAYPEAGAKEARRIPATELAALKNQPREQPTFVTVAWRDAATEIGRASCRERV